MDILGSPGGGGAQAVASLYWLAVISIVSTGTQRAQLITDR